MEQILDKQPSTSSTVITDSIEISEDSNGESVMEAGEMSLYLLTAAVRGLWLKLVKLGRRDNIITIETVR